MQTNHRKIACLSLFATMICSSAAHAFPVLKRPGSEKLGPIINTTSSQLLADDHCPRLAWILPPALGQVETYGRIPRTGLSQARVEQICETMDSLKEKSRSLHTHGLKITEKITDYLEKIAEDQDKIYFLEQDILDRDEELDALSDELDDGELEIEEMEEELNELQDAMVEACLESQAACDEAMDKLSDAEDREDRLRETQEDYEAQVDQLETENDQAEKKIERLWDRVERFKARIKQRQSYLSKSTKTLIEMFRQHANLKGDEVRFAYTNPWEENNRELKRANPNYRFGGVMTRDVRLRANMIPGLGTDSYLSEIRAVLGIEIEGRVVDGKELAFSYLPDAFDGVLKLSMAATCPARDKAEWDILRNKQGDPVFGTMATYKYDLVSDEIVTLSYQSQAVLEYLNEHWSGSGFVSSRDLLIAADTLSQTDILRFVFHSSKKVSPVARERFKRALARRVIEKLLVQQGDGYINKLPYRAPDMRPNAPATTLVPGDGLLCDRATGCSQVKWSLDTEPLLAGAGFVSETLNVGDMIDTDGSILYVP